MGFVSRKAVALLLALMAGAGMSAKENETRKSRFNWNPVINAIIMVESEGNARAVSGSACGAMQIRPIMIRECNSILEKRNSKKRYRMEDRFDLAKSKEMFILIQSHYNPTNNVEKAIRSWNGGPRYSVKGTQAYYEKVMRHLRK